MPKTIIKINNPNKKKVNIFHEIEENNKERRTKY